MTENRVCSAPTETAPPAQGAAVKLPDWARTLIELYESNAAGQFIVYGNVGDRMLLPAPSASRLASLPEFLLSALLSRFDVVLSYDLGNGIRVEKGAEMFAKWPHFEESQRDWRVPRPAIETLTRYFRYCANLTRLNQVSIQIGCIIKDADLLVPPLAGGLDYDLNALACLIRDWAGDALLANHSLATFLVTENLNDLHPLLARNPRAAQIKIDLPNVDQFSDALELLNRVYPTALGGLKADFPAVGAQLAGSTLGALESVIKTREHTKTAVTPVDISAIKRDLVEKDTGGLIEFIDSKRTLEEIYGLEKIKAWLRQDVELWRKNDTAALPKGYLLCGRVGTGKTYLVECLAGEAGVPIV